MFAFNMSVSVYFMLVTYIHTYIHNYVYVCTCYHISSLRFDFKHRSVT